MKEPETGMMVASSPRDCLGQLLASVVLSAALQTSSHDEEDDDAHKRETDQDAARSSKPQRVSRPDEQAWTDNTYT
jgi:hypothetical protein